MAFKIPKSRKELASMNPQEQQQIGEILGRLLAHDKSKFEQAVGMPADQYGAMFNDQPMQTPVAPDQGLATPTSPPAQPILSNAIMSQSSGYSSNKVVKGEPKKFKIDVRNGQKSSVSMDDSTPPSPFEFVIIQKPGGDEEIMSYGTRAKEFLK